MSIRNVLLTLIIGVLFCLAGCAAAPGSKFSALENIPRDSAELIVYRKSALFAMGQAMPVMIDNSQVGELYNASFLKQQLTPGQHHIKITPGLFAQSAEKIVALAAGERKILHFDFPTGPLANAFFIGITLDERDEKTALDDLRDLNGALPIAKAKQ